ncbi:MAG: nitroreductase family protein [Candidatus Odinarchaeia archaeon]
MEFYKVIKGRRSIRKYVDKSVPKELILKIIKAACFAPSAHNSQPWRYIVVLDDKIKNRLAFQMARVWVRDLKKDGLPDDEIAAKINDSMRTITSSPVLIVVFLDMKDMDKYDDRRRKKAEYVMGVQSIAAAIENLILAAHAEGLGTCWRCAPLFCKSVVNRVLKAPSRFDPQAIITLGYPDEKPKPPERKAVEEILRFNTWG